jgi:hypothetical protein
MDGLKLSWASTKSTCEQKAYLSFANKKQQFKYCIAVAPYLASKLAQIQVSTFVYLN